MNGHGRLETLVAALLRYGTWLASAAIGLGLLLALIGARLAPAGPALLPAMRISTMGIALFIALPILRVVLMFLVFLRESDFRLALTAGLVLTIILVSIVLAYRSAAGAAG
jgi:uncharacterized membrane protein